MMQTPGSEILLCVSVARQELAVLDAAGVVMRVFPVSTSRFGLGSEPGSLRTPLGRFHVGEKFGDGAELGMVFQSRVPTGENGLGASDDDLVLTRILWLEGDDAHNANTRERFIYIHGTNHEAAIGQPASHGCIRLRNADVAELYEIARVGMAVTITES